MLDVLSGLLATTAARMLIHSYWIPKISPSSLDKLVTYGTTLFDDCLASMTLSGACHLDDQHSDCSELKLGEAFR